MYSKIKAKVFTPKTLKEYFGIIKNLTNFKPVAGGTDLTVKIKEGELKCDFLVAINNISELKTIKIFNDEIYIGACNTFSELLSNSKIKKLKALHNSMKSLGSPQIRNIATIGGNIANASPAADSIPALLVYDAVLTIGDGIKKYEISIDKFFVDFYKSVLKENELLLGIKIYAKDNLKSDFLKVGHRKSLAISRVNVAYSHIERKNWKIAIGAVTPFPVRLKMIEEFFNTANVTLSKIKELLKIEISNYSEYRKSYGYKIPVIAEMLYKIYTS